LGRLSVVPDNFLNEAILYTFNRAPSASGELPALSSLGLEELSRTLFRGSVDSDYGKQLRWEAETKLLTHIAGKFYSRNQLLNQPAELLANRTADSTDILQEYFVPRAALDDFVSRMRIIIPQNKGNLLNVTLRDVRQDPDTFLRYADRDMIALVLLFNQSMTDAAESQMRLLTQQLIDAALASGGRYYLPYRLEATASQFVQAYPQAKQFFDRKRHYDPNELFQNEMYVKYGKVGTNH
jgi:FAD/FMN-containing dehydrogenase